MAKTFKRENFDVTPEQAAEIDCLQELIRAPTRKDAMLTAVRLALHLATEAQQGHKLLLDDGKEMRRLVILGLETPTCWPWTYLMQISHPWKKQLYVKGRKLPAATVWSAMIVNKLSREEAADNWELPLQAIDEIIEYCKANQHLLEMEAAEERRRLAQTGIKLEPEVAAG